MLTCAAFRLASFSPTRGRGQVLLIGVRCASTCMACAIFCPACGTVGCLCRPVLGLGVWDVAGGVNPVFSTGRKARLLVYRLSSLPPPLPCLPARQPVTGVMYRREARLDSPTPLHPPVLLLLWGRPPPLPGLSWAL